MNMLEEKNAKDEGRSSEVLDKINPYIIRHTFATRCFESGMDPKVVQQLMGHAHYSTTADIYTHVMEKKILEECRKFKNDKSTCSMRILNISKLNIRGLEKMYCLIFLRYGILFLTVFLI